MWFYRRNTKNVSTIAFSSPDQNRTIYSILLIARVQKRKLETFIDVNTDQYLSIAYGFNPVSSARHCVCRRRRNFNARISSSIVVRGDRRRDPRRNSATVRQYLRQTPKAVLRENHFALQVPTSGLGVVYNSATLVIVTTTTIIIIMCTVYAYASVYLHVSRPRHLLANVHETRSINALSECRLKVHTSFALYRVTQTPSTRNPSLRGTRHTGPPPVPKS